MKTIITGLLIILAFMADGQEQVYSIRFKDLNNQDVNMLSFKGKKIIAVIVDAANPDWEQLKSLDTICRNNKAGLQVIAIPVTDFNSRSYNANGLLKTYKQLNLQCIITQIAKAKKSANAGQQTLLKWLTHHDENKRLNNDIDEVGQMYVIGEQGTLYALVKKKMWPTGAWMKKVLAVQGK